MNALGTGELVDLVRRVFRPREGDDAIAILVDLPDAALPDHSRWAVRRAMANDWRVRLDEGRGELGLNRVNLVLYRNVRSNNADLPARAWIHEREELPSSADDLTGEGRPFEEIFTAHRILIAPTELSTTAPLKIAAPRYGCRAATMPGFSEQMIPALRLDWEEVSRRCDELARRLDPAVCAHLRFEAANRESRLTLDLRYRRSTASGGLVREPGTAGNLPSGETYIVPYEGEREGDPSTSSGLLPLELEGELFAFRIEANRVVEVIGTGPKAAAERRLMEGEPARANVAELGLGVLSEFGIHPVGEILLDEKLGLHVAFGRSNHFPGGTVGPKDFRSPDRVVHIDHVYIPEVQPSVRVIAVDLELEGGQIQPLIRDGRYV